MGAVCSNECCFCDNCDPSCYERHDAIKTPLKDEVLSNPHRDIGMPGHAYLRPRYANPSFSRPAEPLKSASGPSGSASCEYTKNENLKRTCCPTRCLRRTSSTNRASSGRLPPNSGGCHRHRQGSFTFHDIRESTPGRSQSAGRNLNPPFPSEDVLMRGLGYHKPERTTNDKLVYVKPHNDGKSAKIVSSQRQNSAAATRKAASGQSASVSNQRVFVHSKSSSCLPFGGKESARMSNNHESYLIAANSQTDMEDWVKAIRRVILSPFGGGIFGQRLDETMRYDRRLDSSATGTTSTGASSRSSRRQAPIIVENCVDFIRSHGGLDEEGIFRLPGHANEVKDLQDAYDMGERPMFPKATDVHTVASLLKGYLRELPEPVIPFERYDALLEAAKISQRDDNCKTTEVDSCSKSREEAKKMIKEQLNLLPQPNFDLLRYLCRFLHQVQQHSEANKMHISNLAMVFGPTVMRPKHDNPHSMISEASRVQHVMFLFISYQKCFFPDDDDQAGMRSLPDITVDALGRSPDAGIGTLTSTTSPPGTLGQRHTTDDSGTGSLGPTPENTNKRAPPVPNAPPPLRAKPNKPMRRKVSESLMTTSAEEQRKSLYDNVTVSSNSASDTASAVPGSRCSSDWRRSNGSAPSESSVTTATTGQGSYYVNNRSTPALSQNGSPRSSTNAVAGSIGTPDSCHSSPADDVSNPRQRALPRAVRRPRGVRPPTSGTYQTDEESNTESVAPDDRTFSTLSSHRSSVHQELDPLEKSRSSSYPNSSRPVTALPRRDVANVSLAINRLSMESGSDASSVSSAPTIPSRPHRRLKKEGASLSSGSRQNSNAEVLSNAGDSSSPPIVTRSSNLVSSTSTSVSGRVTAKEMEDEIRMLKEELQKQRLEHEKRSRMLEEHYIMKMRSSASALAPFTAASASPNPPAPSLASHPIPSCSSIGGAEDLVGSPFQPNSLYPVASYTDESVLMDAAFDGTSIVPQSPHLPLSRRQSSESHAEMKYREEAKRHAMTKIRLRNAERGLKQAEERNRQLQKEMEDFFETFGNLLPEGVM
ncbi:uncharacterized protein LOC143473090 isoform X3 [Clavelina lepadiformis]|uniref:uncharacterized protein LOC143473090 isoform X3 n=1 Tax=Clavelina lepadiformis TaxID=159417 RepID=UPI004042F983